MGKGEVYTIGFDVSHADAPVLVVGERNARGLGLKIINTITGDEVKSLYEKITNKKIENGGNNNE